LGVWLAGFPLLGVWLAGFPPSRDWPAGFAPPGFSLSGLGAGA
jgi:hypothetical protein